MQYARDRFDLDPHWHYCPGCDSAGDFKPDERGLCPKCAEKEKATPTEQKGDEDGSK